MRQQTYQTAKRAARLLAAMTIMLCWCMPALAQKEGMVYGYLSDNYYNHYSANFYKIEDNVLHIYNSSSASS